MNEVVTNGVVMVATGEKYVDQAYRAAESLIKHNHGLEVDLFTDKSIPLGSFSQVHILDEVWVRSKVDAMLQSRFSRTLYLDVDVEVLADISDIFDLLDKFDMAAAHDQCRNTLPALRVYRQSMVDAFPQLNGGVIGLRKSDLVLDFLAEWRREIKNHGISKDQPSFRELLWNRDIKMAILPPEYNFWEIAFLDKMKPERHAAPRILHATVFLNSPPPAAGKDRLVHYFGRARAYKMGLLTKADKALAQRAGRDARLPTRRENIQLKFLVALSLPSRIAAYVKKKFRRSQK